MIQYIDGHFKVEPRPLGIFLLHLAIYAANKHKQRKGNEVLFFPQMYF